MSQGPKGLSTKKAATGQKRKTILSKPTQKKENTPRSTSTIFFRVIAVFCLLWSPLRDVSMRTSSGSYICTPRRRPRHTQAPFPTDRIGDRSRHSHNVSLSNKDLDEKASKIANYRELYRDHRRQLDFLPAIASTSGRIHSELLRLLLLHAHREESSSTKTASAGAPASASPLWIWINAPAHREH